MPATAGPPTGPPSGTGGAGRDRDEDRGGEDGGAPETRERMGHRGPRYYRLSRLRFSRGRCCSTIGVPTKPNSSRSRRSMKRSYAASSLPLVNSTNVGGAVDGLGAEQDLGLLAAAHRVRVLGDQPAEEAR